MNGDYVFSQRDEPFLLTEIADYLHLEYESVRSVLRRLKNDPETKDKVEPLGPSRYAEYSAATANFIADAFREKARRSAECRKDACEWGIYALADPDSGNVRYVGQTNMSFRLRFGAHLSAARKRAAAPVSRWIKSLLDEGKNPKMIILEKTPKEVLSLDELERQWIRRKHEEGCALLNIPHMPKTPHEAQR